MNLKQRFIYKFAIGFSLGVFVDLLIKAIVCYSDKSGMFVAQHLVDFTGNYATALILDLMLVGMLGAVCNGAAVVYEIESWSALRATFTHFIFSIIACMTAGKILGWFTPGISWWNTIQYIAWVFAYAMIWLIQYLIGKKEVREINKSVENMKKSDVKD